MATIVLGLMLRHIFTSVVHQAWTIKGMYTFDKSYLLFLAVQQLTLVLNPEVIEIVRVSVKFESVLLVLPVRGEHMQFWGRLTFPAKGGGVWL